MLLVQKFHRRNMFRAYSTDPADRVVTGVRHVRAVEELSRQAAGVRKLRKGDSVRFDGHKLWQAAALVLKT